MANKCDQKPPLYTTLHREIGKTGYAIPHEIFESYGLIISGLRSAVVLQNQTTVSTEQLSTRSAILKDAAALESQCQNPKRRLDENAAGVVEVESKLVLLTPEQQRVFNGPDRQFIIGAPGTGKTIIIQAKVAQLLKEGKNVVIYTEDPFDGKYKKLFGSHDSCGIGITERHPTYFQYVLEKRMIWLWLIDHSMPENFGSVTLTIRETLEKLRETHRNSEKLSERIRGSYLMQGSDSIVSDSASIFIDDAFDWRSFDPKWKRRLIYANLSRMAHARFRSEFVWVACDAYLNDSDDEPYKQTLNQIIRGDQGDYFSTAILDRVMRSSESVFQATYSPEVIQRMAIKPVLGHKIHGFYDSVHLSNLSLKETLLEIWKHTYNAVTKFKDDGFGYEHMAILIGGEKFEHPYIHGYLWAKCMKNGIPVENNVIAWHSPGFITLDTWDSVSSFEWPVVIYIAMFEAQKQRQSAAYDRYRTCSRATMKLFEITASY